MERTALSKLTPKSSIVQRAMVKYGVESILNVPIDDLPDLKRWRQLIIAI